jgi:hypothetical protein
LRSEYEREQVAKAVRYVHVQYGTRFKGWGGQCKMNIGMSVNILFFNNHTFCFQVNWETVSPESKQTMRAHLILHHWISLHATPSVSRRWPGGNAGLIVAVSGAGYNNSTAEGRKLM